MRGKCCECNEKATEYVDTKKYCRNCGRNEKNRLRIERTNK